MVIIEGKGYSAGRIAILRLNRIKTDSIEHGRKTSLRQHRRCLTMLALPTKTLYVGQLFTTKLYVPQLSNDLVPRPRLYERLDECLTRKLTLISAPAGFGKSTLVAGWLSEIDRSVAWLSLDRGDNDPVRFWTYLIAAIQTIHREIGAEARQIISAPQLRSAEPASISLINDISQLARDFIVVLDDYHVIEEERVHAGLSYLLEHQPSNLHIVLLSRVDPSMSLARLRAHGQMVEIRAEDLQFSTEEAATLLNQKIGLNLKPEHIEALNTHTENWAVGLQLAALALKGQSSSDTFIEEFTGGHQFILDYLTEEVLDTLPDAQRGFLLRTSILERFCGGLCHVVTGDPSSRQMLDEIRKSNLFLIPLDTDGRWFRYHHLFAEVLHALLERDHPGEIDGLHLKAAEWFEGEGYPGEAVGHVLRSADTARAGELVLKHWLPAVHRGEVATVLNWLAALPEEMEADDPSISLARCWAFFISGNSSAIGPHLERANGTFERLVNADSLSGTRKDYFSVQLSMMHSVLARDRGEHSKSVAHAEEAARFLTPNAPETIGTAWTMLAAARAGAGDYAGALEACGRGISPALAEGNLTVAYGCTYGRAMYMLIQGRLNEAEGLCRLAIDRAVGEGHGDFPAAGWLHIAMARIGLERYRLDDAGTYLNNGLRIALPGGFGEVGRSGCYLRAHLAAERGDPDTASEKLHILNEKCAVTHHANLLLGRRRLVPRLLCAEGRHEEALTAVDESIHHARAANSNGELIRLLALRAVALEASGDRMHARPALHEAMALGAPEGYIWRWLEAGPELEPLLRSLADDHDADYSPYLDSLLDACQAAFGESVRPRSREMPDPLTPRELEIMRLICEGYSNPEIAGELVVTLNTIKKHTSNIYSKIAVRSRTQAIAYARKLHLF